MRVFIALYIFVFTVVAARAEIRVIDSVEQIEQELEKCTPNSLVFISVTDILVSSNDPLLLRGNEVFRRDWFLKNYPEITHQERVSLAAILLMEKNLWCLVDERWPAIIASAQSRGIKVAAIAKIMSDPTLQGLVADVLTSLGLKFKDVFPELKSEKLFEYANGVIETEAPLKGLVVKKVLESLSKRPDLVVFVNDKQVQVQSVEDVCREMYIPCVAFHWTGYPKATSFDENVADLQLRTLAEERRWISAGEARE